MEELFECLFIPGLIPVPIPPLLPHACSVEYCCLAWMYFLAAATDSWFGLYAVAVDWDEEETGKLLELGEELADLKNPPPIPLPPIFYPILTPPLLLSCE